MRKNWLILITGGLASAMILGLGATETPAEKLMIPTEVMGWRWDGKDKVYDRETIFAYIDGMGEVYRAYNFRQVLVRRYEKPEQPSIVVDLFDMGSPEDAFGVFTFERDGDPVSIGQGADYAVGMLRFWKGRYFVAITAEKETPETKEAVLALGKAIADAIHEEGSLPALLQVLPRNGLDEQRILFFRHYMILNRHYFLADRDILNLSPKVEGVLAPYKVGKDTLRLLLVRYPSEEEAAKGWATFSRAYLREGRAKGVVRTENRKWTAARLLGRTLLVVLDAPTERSALQWLQEVEQKLLGAEGRQKRSK